VPSLLEIEDMRLVVKFGEKKRNLDREYEAIYEELVEAGLDDQARRDSHRAAVRTTLST
jgi:hypothetical protein